MDNEIIPMVSDMAGDAPVFAGTQVPVNELHCYMPENWNLYEFPRKFPMVTMGQSLDELERSVRKTAKRIIRSDGEITGEAPVFADTDVPVKRMFDYLTEAKSLKDFH